MTSITRTQATRAIGPDALSVYTLANMADCYTPDALDSPGAQFLDAVRDAVIDAVANDWLDPVERDENEAAHEIADSAVPVYTHERWATFVDLGAYREDIFELGYEASDMTQLAGVALYMIADRLVADLCRCLSDAFPDDDDETHS